MLKGPIVSPQDAQLSNSNLFSLTGEALGKLCCVVPGPASPGTWHTRACPLRGCPGHPSQNCNISQLPTCISSQSDTTLAFYPFILFVIRKLGSLLGSGAPGTVTRTEKAQCTFVPPTRRRGLESIYGMERHYHPLLLTSFEVLAQLLNFSDPQFLHLEYGVPPISGYEN